LFFFTILNNLLFFIMPAMDTRRSNSRRRRSLYKILAVVYVVVVFPVPTNSFGCSPTAATSSGRRNNKDLSPLRLPSDDNIGIFNFPQKSPSATTVLSLSPNKKNDDEGGEKRQNTQQQRQGARGLLDEKNIPGLVFTTVLTLWHFWIGPAIRPFLLDMQH
jgi:hypothetical protein